MTRGRAIRPHRVTLRPKVSHRLPLIRVADTEKKEGLSDGVWALRMIVLSAINLSHNIPSGIEYPDLQDTRYL
jgi:hypothetical protein